MLGATIAAPVSVATCLTVRPIGPNSPNSLDLKTPRVAPPPVVFLGALCIGLAVHCFKPRALLADAAIGYATGGVLILLGLALSMWVVLHFRRSGTPVSPLQPSRQLVVSGPYRFSRNPDYIGQALFGAGMALVLNSIWVLLAQLPALVLVHFFVIAREERYLASRFGARYAGYCQRVPRWF